MDITASLILKRCHQTARFVRPTVQNPKIIKLLSRTTNIWHFCLKNYDLWWLITKIAYSALVSSLNPGRLLCTNPSVHPYRTHVYTFRIKRCECSSELHHSSTFETEIINRGKTRRHIDASITGKSDSRHMIARQTRTEQTEDSFRQTVIQAGRLIKVKVKINPD